MRAQLSVSSLFYIILILGLAYGLVLFSQTQFADSLRQFGVPIPYCTTHPLVSMCTMDYLPVSASLIGDVNTLNVFLFTVPSKDMLNAMCSLSQSGANVRVVMNNLLKSNKQLLSQFDECKVKYRFSPYVTSNELSTGRCYLNFTSTYGVYTCCKDIVSRFEGYFEEVWKSASP